MAILSPAQRAILTTRLAEAEAAYHTLLTGGATKVFVDQNGERVEYQTGSTRGLVSYIASLKSQLGVGCATGPMNVWL